MAFSCRVSLVSLVKNNSLAFDFQKHWHHCRTQASRFVQCLTISVHLIVQGILKFYIGPSFLVPSPHSRKPRWISFLRLVIRNVYWLIAP